MEKGQLRKEAYRLVQQCMKSGANGTRVTAIAAQLGISWQVLMRVNGGEGDGVSEETLWAIVNGLSAPAREVKKVETNNYALIQEVCARAQRRHGLYGVIGYPGAGKTVALDSYYRSNENTFYIEAKKSMNQKQFWAELLVCLGESYTSNAHNMLNASIVALNKLQNPLLIIDEAGKLNEKIHLDLHDLRNATMNSTGIILAGVDYLQKDLVDRVRKERSGFPEWYSRIQKWYKLWNISGEEIEAVCVANGVNDEAAIAAFKKLKTLREVFNAMDNWQEEQATKNNENAAE